MTFLVHLCTMFSIIINRESIAAKRESSVVVEAQMYKNLPASTGISQHQEIIL